MQYVHYLQRKYSLNSFNLLGHTAPAQAATLLVVGPFLDYWLTEKRVDMYDYNLVSVVSAINLNKLHHLVSYLTLLAKPNRVIMSLPFTNNIRHYLMNLVIVSLYFCCLVPTVFRLSIVSQADSIRVYLVTMHFLLNLRTVSLCSLKARSCCSHTV